MTLFQVYFKDLKLIVVLRSLPNLEQTGPLHMSPVDMAGPLAVTNVTDLLGSYENFQPGFRDDKRPKTSCDAKFEKKSKHGETQSYKFRPIITLATLVAVSLMSNGMLMMWKIQKAKQDDAEFIRKLHPGNRAEVFIWQNFQPTLITRSS